jgi:hypothetical protein
MDSFRDFEWWRPIPSAVPKIQFLVVKLPCKKWLRLARMLIQKQLKQATIPASNNVLLLQL